MRLDRHATASRPASSAYVFFDKLRVYVVGNGACAVHDLTAVSSIVPTIGADMPASFWDPYGNLGILTRVTNRLIPSWTEATDGTLEFAGRKRVGIWRQPFRGGVIELGFVDGDPGDRPYSATWRSNGDGLKLSGGAFTAGDPDASVFVLPAECVN